MAIGFVPHFLCFRAAPANSSLLQHRDEKCRKVMNCDETLKPIEIVVIAPRRAWRAARPPGTPALRTAPARRAVPAPSRRMVQLGQVLAVDVRVFIAPPG